MTMFGLNVERTRRREPQEDLGPEAALMAELKALLPPEACVFAAASVPLIVVCHRGRALGLHLMARDGRLTHAETNAFIVLRAAGMRIEVARDAGQAKAMLREMGVPLREEAQHSLRDVFRQEANPPGDQAALMEFFRVTNWDQYQHYKDRDPAWIKLYARLLDDYGFATLPDNSKWHLVGIFLLASKQGNRIPGDPRWVRKKIAARTRVDLEGLLAAGFIEEDASTAPADCSPPAIPEKESESEERREETDMSADADVDESFEEFWKAYPTDPLMSKKRTRAEWERLNAADRAAALQTVPAFRELCASRVTYRPVHAWRFLAERRFDGFMRPPPIDAAKIAEARDRADRLLRRGKYAERYE